MKKYLLAFIVLILIGFVYLTFNYLKQFDPKPIRSSRGFVQLEKNQFLLNNKPFYPIVINYLLSLQTDGNEMWPCPAMAYNIDSKHKYDTKDSSLYQLKADLELIKEMGFNCIRLGVVPNFDIESQKTTIPLSTGKESNISYDLVNEENYTKFFNALSLFFHLANESGLKVIFLTKVLPDYPFSEIQLKKLSSFFKNDSTILAYDFFNEPLYFDAKERKKEDVISIVKKWRKILKNNAPNHLCTIGLAGIREVFEWDPNILDIDFVSFHPYEYEPEQVRNEIYWYNKYVKKPWMIGETSIPADNDSVPYEEQRKFAEKTIQQTYNCGAVGYSWWQYKDVEWHYFHANFMGVISQKGRTETKNGYILSGTPKPVSTVFKNTYQKNSCICLENYYNYSNHNSCRIIGKVVDEQNFPIEGAVILGWNENWSSSFHTITKKNGTFELLGSFSFYHWMISATEFSMVRGELNPDSCKIGEKNRIPTINIGSHKLSKIIY
jgi:hypothetical protein